MTTKIESPTYWRSLNQLAETEEYKQFVEREFPTSGSELNDGHSRRSFLRIMGASIALAGFAACRRPVQKILPHRSQPENLVVGVPVDYATAYPFQGVLTGLLVTTNDGRPTKVEGNPDHPNSKGGTNLIQQAAILGMYDPDRSRSARNNGNAASWDDFVAFAAKHFSADRRVLFVSEANSSQTYLGLKSKALSKFKNGAWVTFESFGEANVIEGTRVAFGKKLRPYYHFDKSSVIVSLDDDFLSNPRTGVDASKRFAKSRKVRSEKDSISRLFVVENNFTVTGSMADHRLRLKAGDVPAFTMALAAELSKSLSGLSEFSGYSNEFNQHSWLKVLAQELISSRGKSTVSAGEQHIPVVHATVAAINAALGNINNTVTYHDVTNAGTADTLSTALAAFNDLKAGKYDTVVFIGGNPAYNAPSDFGFAEAIKGKTSIHLSEYVDETSKLCTWHVNRTHFLEAWGDGTSATGVASIVQPMIQPLFNGKSEIEFLNAVVNGTDAKGYDLVKATWAGLSTASWKTALHDGFIAKTEFAAQSVTTASGFASTVRTALATTKVTPANDMELVIKADPKVFDGRFANNGWLQELPDPITKITWDNVALISIGTAQKLGLNVLNNDKEVPFVDITADGKTQRIPAWVLPGHADNSITVYSGYGRVGVGRVASRHEFADFDLVGFDVNPLRTTANASVSSRVSIKKGTDSYIIACTQDHHSMEGRPLIRKATLAEYKNDPTFAPDMVKVPGKKGDEPAISLFTPQGYPDYEPQWGMAIDLNSCTGCGVCTIACQAENNIPVVGKREVARGREMHWIRTDRYFVNNDDLSDRLKTLPNEDKIGMVHQPIPCMHCEMAPCEQVCPVAATTHSDDGLNQMTYNRCIGTRYCANNCPFKVRRFNFFNYPKEFLTVGNEPEIVQMAMNPDVSIRFRGVIEKCTYCVQRINRAKIATKNKTGNSVKPNDGEVKTACQQACPSDAIYFGDITDKNSKVAKIKANNRNYLLLEELNIRPRTSYLARITNPSTLA